MKYLLLIANCLLLTANCFSQLPDCDIFLLDIKDSAGQISFSNPVNITNRKGYDNQPAFSPDGKYILFSSQKDSAGPTDIYKYDLKTKATKQLTETPESEYSPTFMPDGWHISAVVVEKDSTQRLWSFELFPALKAPIESQKEKQHLRPLICIMDKIKEVGYHCWINKDSVAVFVLTKPSFTLQIMNVAMQKPLVVADSIGRCMRMKNGKLWYTSKEGIFNNVFEYSARSKKSVLQGVIESEDYCFYGKNSVWSVSENLIMSGFMNSKTGATEIADLSKFGITKPARITVSPDGKKLAVVSNK